MSCLLCGQDWTERQCFSDLIFLRQSQAFSCPSCQSSFVRISECHCPLCYKDQQDGVCADCQYWQSRGHQVDHQAIYVYNQAMKDYFSLYKFFGDYALARLFGKTIKQALRAYKGYVVVPVPVSPKTYQERGFNQVEGFLKAAGVSYMKLLIKGEGAKQSSKSRAERLQSCPSYELLQSVALPERVLLVDDIYTTGATLAQLVDLLHENGVKDVKTFSLSR